MRTASDVLRLRQSSPDSSIPGAADVRPRALCSSTEGWRWTSSHGLKPPEPHSSTIDGMNNADMVTVRKLRKSYGRRVVVDGLDLDVRVGEIVGLIGANGAGKTTTVECIQGLLRPASGMLRVFGLEPATQADRLRPMIGSQLQDSSLPDRLRVSEAVALFGSAARGSGDDLLEEFGLAALRRSAFASLSG